MVAGLMSLLKHLKAFPAVRAVIAVNVAVFLAWQVGFMAPDFGTWLYFHGTLSLAHLQEGHVWTTLTSAFSHMEFWHLLLNMFVLFNFGAIMELSWGWRRFLVFYLGACLVSGLMHVAFSLFGWPDDPGLGASGAVSAVLIAFVFLYPRHKLLLFMVVPLPAWVAAVLLVGVDLWGLVSQRDGGGLPIGHGAHLGGALFGIVWSLASWNRRARDTLPLRTRP